MITALKADAVFRRSHKAVVRLDLIAPGQPAVTLDLLDATVDLDNGLTDYFQAFVRVPFTEAIWLLVREYAVCRVSCYGGYPDSNGNVTMAEFARLYTRTVTSNRPDDAIDLGCAGVSRLVDDYPITTAGVLTGNVKTVVQGIINGALPTLVVSGSTSATVPAETEVRVGDSRIATIEAICDATDTECLPRPDGTMRVRTQPTLATATDAGLLDVGATGVILDSQSNYDRDAFGNAVLARAEWTDPAGLTQIRNGWAYNVDPADPSRWNGPAGRKVFFDLRDTKTSVAGLEQIARSILYRRAGAGRGATMTVPLALWLEPGDKVTVRLPWGDPYVQLVQTVSHDLVGLTSRVTTRMPYTTSITSETPALLDTDPFSALTSAEV